MKAALVDTSSILFGFKYKKDVFEALERQMPSYKATISKGVIRELRYLGRGNGKNAAIARAALVALKSKKVDVHNININVDAWLSKDSRKDDIIISNDTELVKDLSKTGITCFKVSKSGMLKRYV